MAEEATPYLYALPTRQRMDTLGDTALFDAFRNGNEQAFETLFRTYYQRLCRYALTFTKDQEEAEDLVQQLFVKLWEKRATLEPHSSVKAYLFRAVYHAALNQQRRMQQDRKLREDQQLQIVHSSNEATQKMAGDDFKKALAEAMDALPKECRRIFELSRFEEMKYKEIASHLDLSVKTVENQMGKALRILRERLSGFLPLALIILVIKTIFKIS